MLGCFPNKNSNIHVWLKAPHRQTDSTFKGKRAKDLRILIIQDWVSHSFLMCLIYVWKHCQKGERMDRNQEYELSHMWKRTSKLWWQLITSWRIYKQMHTVSVCEPKQPFYLSSVLARQPRGARDTRLSLKWQMRTHSVYRHIYMPMSADNPTNLRKEMW